MKQQNLELEKSLINKVKQDKKHFDELYKYFLNDVYRFSYSLVNNRENAEDITSKTFILLYQKIDSFEWKGISLKNWLFQTSRNYAYDKYREVQTDNFDEEFHSENEYEISFVDEIMDKDLLEKVRDEILLLSPVEQEVINLRIWEGMQFNEIAQIQNASEITTKQRFYRSIEKIKKNLEKKNIKSLIALPLLFTAISQVGATTAYAAPMSLASIGISALVTKTTMSTTLTSIKAFLASKAGAAAIAATVVVGSAGTAGVYYANNKSKNKTSTPVVQNTPAPTQIVPSSIPTIQPSLSPTGDTYVGWKSYTDNRLGITLKYPNNFQIVDSIQEVRDVRSFIATNNTEVIKESLSLESKVNTDKLVPVTVEIVDIKGISFDNKTNEEFIKGNGEYNPNLSNLILQINGKSYKSQGSTYKGGVKQISNAGTCISELSSNRLYFNIDNIFGIVFSYNSDSYECDPNTAKLFKKDSTQEDIDFGKKIIESIIFQTSQVIQNSTPKISYIKTKNTTQATDDELWISELDGSRAQKLEVGEVIETYNTLSKDYIFFRKPRALNATSDSISVYNLNTKQVKDIVENDFADGYAYIQGQNTTSVSPDSNIVVYSLSYTQKKCEHVCSPIDSYPQYKSGMYAYNLKTDKKVYLGKFLIITNWDKDSKHIYTRMGEKYHDYDLSKGNYKINIDTGKSTLVLEDNNFHVSSYHLEEQATVIKGTSGLESTPQKLIVQKSGKENIIFEAPGLAFQPTFYISPDRTQFLFRKKSTAKFSNLTTLNDIVLVNLKNLSMKTVFENNNQSTSLPIWIDNQNFIIAIGPEDFTKGKDLYIVNVNTKAQKRITTSGDVSLW